MNDYPKINTLYMRDKKKVIIPSEYTKEEFLYLRNNLWECTEKIDGTNIHIDLIDGKINFCGRTEKASIPAPLFTVLQTIFTKEIMEEVFGEGTNVSVYGEGYGRKIQGCGGRYIKNGVNFILFDVKIGEFWLSRKKCEEIAEKLNVQIVPLIGYMTIHDAAKMVEKGFKSLVSEDCELYAEGLILKAPNGLKFRNGERIITKIKHVDYVNYNNK